MLKGGYGRETLLKIGGFIGDIKGPIAIFRKDAHELSRWKTVIAPAIGLIGLLAFLAIILVNLPVLVGEASYGPFSIGVLVLLAVAFALGPIVAAVRKNAELS